MEKYERLSYKLGKGTITEEEKNELFIMAFGSTYLRAQDKGSLREYYEKN